MLRPLLVLDSDTDQLVTAVLRPGTAHASRGALAVLKRLVPALRAAWPGVAVELRADSGFAAPALYAYCEAHDVGYTIALLPNARLAARAAPLLAEALPKGPNTRFVATTRADEALALYDWYVDRGAAEGWIKDYKRACRADRLSCRAFWANQFRLFLHTAYWLLDTRRRWLADAGVARTQLDTLRLRLLKVAGWVREHAVQVRLRLAASHPGQPLWPLLAARHGRP